MGDTASYPDKFYIAPWSPRTPEQQAGIDAWRAAQNAAAEAQRARAAAHYEATMQRARDHAKLLTEWLVTEGNAPAEIASYLRAEAERAAERSFQARFRGGASPDAIDTSAAYTAAAWLQDRKALALPAPAEVV